LTQWTQNLTYGLPYEKETRYIDAKLSNEHIIITFNYPEGDVNGGRLVLNGAQSDLPIWNLNGNYVMDVPNGNNNTLWKGLNHWYNDSGTPNNQNDDRPLDNSDLINGTADWFLRREVAWASGTRTHIPDTSLPPVYGRSQVVDIEPALQQNPVFTIKCCVLHKNGENWNTTNFSLVYRYNGANSSYQWTNWKCYSTIHTTPYRFTFNANSAKGTGKYEFCSILNTTTLPTKHGHGILLARRSMVQMRALVQLAYWTHESGCFGS
jgi:hypothetical protein